MIYDCFLYYDEDMLLDIRLNTLSDVVDRFVIVESTHSFTGKPKKLNFDIEKFKKFKDKIIYIIYDQEPFKIPHSSCNIDAWRNEAETRNAIMLGLKNATDEDLILVSDVDEIFNPDIFKKIKRSSLCTTIHMNFYNYQFNLQVFNSDGSPRIWTLPRATTFKNLKKFFAGKPEDLRNIKKSNIRNKFFKWNLLKMRNKKLHNGGWHFSWIMTPERISEKISSISHTEYDLPEFNNKKHIIEALTNGKDIWGRDRIMLKQELTREAFPAYITEKTSKFKEFIL